MIYGVGENGSGVASLDERKEALDMKRFIAVRCRPGSGRKGIYGVSLEIISLKAQFQPNPTHFQFSIQFNVRIGRW